MSRRYDSREKTKRLFRRVVKNSLTVTKKEPVSVWAEKHRVLDESSNLAGKWSNNVTPYLVEIMDTLTDRDIRKVFFCKASQIGGTEALLNMLCYVVCNEPAPTMIVYPSDDLAKDTSNDRLQPALRLIPEARELFLDTQSKELQLRFKSMNLYLRGAGSPAKLASKPIKYLFFDEIDKMAGASKKEASPYNLALERTKTYRPQEKVFATSTPTLKTNYIWNLTDSADEVRHFFVPCPHCGEMIELKWSQIRFGRNVNEDLPEEGISHYELAQTAIYACQACGGVIGDNDKLKMLRNGAWKAVKKRGVGAPKSVGFWISSLYSVFLKWSDIVEEFLDSKDDPEKLQNFVNSWLGEPWEDTQLKTSAEMVKDRQTDLEEFVVPSWAKLICGGVDVQETSLYYVIRAFGDYTTSQLLTRGQVLSFHDIMEIMNREFTTEDGEKMIVNLCLIDSGYQPDDTYDFCIDNADWAMSVKGASNPMRDRYKISKIDKADSKAYGMPLVICDGGKYKDSIAARMHKENGTGSWMVYKDIDDNYCNQVTSEHKVTVRNPNGTTKTKWEQKESHADNHYLDCEVYAMCAAEIMGVKSLHLKNIQAPVKRPEQEETYEPEKAWIQENENWLTGE